MNDKDFEEELIHNYKTSGIVITIFFACLDFISLIIFSFHFKPDNKNINNLKKILIKLFSIDIIIRILYTRKYSQWNIYKEIVLNIMTSIQFYFVVSFLYLSYLLLFKSKKSYPKGTVTQLCYIFFIIFLIFIYYFYSIIFHSYLQIII